MATTEDRQAELHDEVGRVLGFPRVEPMLAALQKPGPALFTQPPAVPPLLR